MSSDDPKMRSDEVCSVCSHPWPCLWANRTTGPPYMTHRLVAAVSVPVPEETEAKRIDVMPDEG